MKTIKIKKIISSFVVSLLSILSSAALADEIRIGMSAALSGLSQDLGQQMQQGIELRFSQENKRGGVNGKQLKLITLDDGYKPLKAAANMRTLIDGENVIAIIGNTGTPTAVLTAPIANQKNTLMFGAYTGADFLRSENSGCCIYNYRASYKQETAIMVQHILDSGIKPDEIAFFTQNDAYGDAGYSGAIAELKVQGYQQAEQLLDTRYRRNTTNIEQAAADVLALKTAPKAIIMVGSYEASSAFIKLLKPEHPDLKFYNISFTGSDSLLKHLGPLSEGVYMTEVVPNVHSISPLATTYRNAINSRQESSAIPNTVSLEGYIVADILIQAMHSISGNINRHSILLAVEDIIRSKNNALEAEHCLNNAPRQVSQTIWLNQVQKGRFETIYVNRCGG